MTRKRFIKLMMSYGISRNEAVKIAADYNSRNIPYETAYKKEVARRSKPFITIDTGKLKQGVAEAIAALNNLASAVNRAFGRGVC